MSWLPRAYYYIKDILLTASELSINGSVSSYPKPISIKSCSRSFWCLRAFPPCKEEIDTSDLFNTCTLYINLRKDLVEEFTLILVEKPSVGNRVSPHLACILHLVTASLEYNKPDKVVIWWEIYFLNHTVSTNNGKTNRWHLTLTQWKLPSNSVVFLSKTCNPFSVMRLQNKWSVFFKVIMIMKAKEYIKNQSLLLGTEANAFNPHIWEADSGGSLWVQGSLVYVVSPKTDRATLYPKK